MATKVALREFKGNDRFIIESILGEGGMGVVYRARDVKRASAVALKTMTRLDPAALLRFKKEFRALADIAHPSVVQLYELFAEGDQWFFTMELLEGTDFVSYVRGITRVSGAQLTRTDSGAVLRSALPRPGPLVSSAPTIEASMMEGELDASSLLAIANSGEQVGDEGRLRAALLGLLEGMLAIHAAGRLHRDIKPSNVMVTPEGRVVLLDFGVVGELGKGGERVEDLVLGTPAYMAPEQARATHVGPAADFYAMGVMLYEALTGQLPFDGAPEEVLYAKQQGRPRPPSEIVEGVPADLGSLCLDLLAPAQQDRPDGAEILDRLRAERPRVRTTARNLNPSTTTGSLRAFVGRETELSELRQGLRRASRGEVVVTLVSGASGIGKTTLIQRFLKEVAQTPRTLVLSGRCYEREAVPFKGFDSVVDELSRWLSLMPQQDLGALLPVHAAELLRVFPVLRGVPALERRAEGRPEAGEPQELRRRAFMALRSLLGAIADDRPLVVHIDDLQWADVDSIALLDQVLHAPGAPAIMLLGSFRSEALGKSQALTELLGLAERLGKGAHVQRIELSRLGYDDCARLAALSLGDRAESSPEVVRRIAEESQGLPLFVSELSAWQRTAGTDEASGLISLDAVIQGRVDELPGEGRALLEVLCVAGGPLPCGVVDRVLGMQESDALRARLRVAKLTRSVESSDRDLVDIYHGRIRDSLLAGIGTDQQRSLHARLANALESSGGFDPGSLVEHFMAAGDQDGARRHVLPAAEAAERGLAFLRAAKLYRHAVELGVDHPRWQLQRSVGDMLLSAGHAAEAAAAFAEAVHHAPAAERTALRRMAAEHFLKSGGETEGLRLLREALADVKLGYPETTASAVVSLVGNRARLMWRGLRFQQRENASPNELERIDVAFAASSGLAMFDLVRAADFGARHLLLALEGGEPIRLCRALAIEASGRAAVETGARDGIEGLVRTAESLATRSNDPHAIALARLAAGLVRVFSGEWRAAQSILDAAEQIIRERCRGVHWELANAVAWSMNALILCGELREAAQRVPEVLREAQERADRFALMHMVYPAAITAIVADDPDTADRIAREFPRFGGEFSDRFTGGHWGSLVSRVSANRYRGRGRLAHSEMEVDFTKIKAAHFLRVHMMRVCTTFERALCALSAAEDGGDQAALWGLAERCARELLADRPDYAAPMGHHVMGCLLAAKGRRDEALEQLDLAIIGLSRVDMGYFGELRQGQARGAGWRRSRTRAVEIEYGAAGGTGHRKCGTLSGHERAGLSWSEPLSVVRQQALTVLGKVAEGRESALDQWLRDNKKTLQRALARSSTTHFARWVLFGPSRGEAGEAVGEQHLLAFETNFDGELQDHLADLRAALGGLLDGAFAGVEGYPGSENLNELAAFFRSSSLRAAAFYVAHPGLSVSVVHGDATLKSALEERLRQLSQGARVNAGDALSLARELQHTAQTLAAQQGLTLGYVDRGLREKPGVIARAFMRPFAVIIAFLLSPFFELRDELVRKRQPSWNTPELRAKRDGIGLEEDRVDQNGLTHLVPIKRGWYRSFALGVMVHLVTALSDAGGLVGSLGGIQTIHFARWVVLPDGRLLFFSNYDGSWEAYLGDFVDKASMGLTMIWTNTLWYPKTRLLLFQGAKDEEAFKAWTRACQVPTQVWYSAYPTLSVGDVLKNAKLRELLGSPLTPQSSRQLLALL